MNHKNIENEIADFLMQWDYNKMADFLEDVMELFDLYNIRLGHDWVLDLVGADDVKNVRLTRTVYIMSKIAIKYGSHLYKLNCTFKSLPHRMEEIAKLVKKERNQENVNASEKISA